VGITEILNPDFYANTGHTPVKVILKNFGNLIQTSIPLTYHRGYANPVNENWTGILLPGDSVQYTFTTLMYVPLGNLIYLCAYTSLANDTYNKNDTICKSVHICDVGSAGNITGPTNVSYGGTYTYTVPAIINATSYNWVYFPNTGVTIVNNGTSANITFGTGSITYGMLSVNGFNPLCSGIPSSLLFPDGVDELATKNFWLSQNTPNPTTDFMSIEFNLPSDGDVQIAINNLFGQLVYSINKKYEKGKNSIVVNVNDLSAGLYYYTLKFKGNRLVKKMVVSK